MCSLKEMELVRHTDTRTTYLANKVDICFHVYTHLSGLGQIKAGQYQQGLAHISVTWP